MNDAMTNPANTEDQPDARPVVYLCGGTQSSGSTLISWCFLQRADMDGVLDQRNEVLPTISPRAAQPYGWCKFTISCFRFSEVKVHLEDEGWEVRPLLVVRDVRTALNSLLVKSYGRNGITAEEPPLRMRFRRFKEDWELFRRMKWPMLQYERFIHQPEQELRRACGAMGLGWDDGMLHWHKRSSNIASPVHGNATFRQTCGENLAETLKPARADFSVDRIPPADLQWLEEEFAEFNRDEGYPAQLARRNAWNGPGDRLTPRWENTRRYRKKRRKNPLWFIVDALSR